jgi:hypothetical protein
MKRFYEINPLIHQKEYYPDSVFPYINTLLLTNQQ